MNSSKSNRDLAFIEALPYPPIGSPAPTASAGKPCSTSALVVLALLLMVLIVRQASAQKYTAEDILVSDGGSFEPLGLTDAGQVTGSYQPPGGLGQPAYWQNGQMTLLPLLPGTVSGGARNGNSLGHLVGDCLSLRTNGTYASHACLWTHGVVQALLEVPGTDESSAWAINDAGTITGNVYTGGNPEAVVWSGNAVTKLTPPMVGAHTRAQAINSFGQVAVTWTRPEVPSSQFDFYPRPARWTPDVPNGTTGSMVVLDFMYYAWANDIGSSGVVCGASALEPVTWVGSAKVPIPYSHIDYYNKYGYAYGINEAGAVVGDLEDDAFSTVPFVWDAQYGTRDLNTLLASSTTYAYPGNLCNGHAINNAGQILVSTGYIHYSLLTPVSPPAPTLTIQLTASNTLAVSWPSPSSGFVLQQNTNGISTVNWSNVIDTIQDDGTNKQLIVSPTSQVCFYRLFKP